MDLVTAWDRTSHQQFERDWWGDCLNTFGEETKQLTYAHRMGLRVVPHGGHWPVYDLKGVSVLDLGGGPVSLLLKCLHRGACTVVDPCRYPDWIALRYRVASIQYVQESAEDWTGAGRVYDECWIYNVLQHVVNPKAVLATAKRSARVLRIFEWIDLPSHLGHPHELKSAALEQWLDARGTIEEMHENGCEGTAWYGVVPL